jgi:hypothetical protein
MLVLFAVPSFANDFSFIGNFVQDNEIQLFNFNLINPDTITLQTWSYGGGFNQRGELVDGGGFEPVLQIYDNPTGAANGPTFFPGLYSSCGPNNQDFGRDGACYDIYAPIFLPAGSYWLVLLQNPNAPVGSNNLADGFQFDSDPYFANGFYGSFAGTSPDGLGWQARGTWAVDILNVDDATLAPEPSSAALFAAAAALAAVGARKMRRRTAARS